MEPWGSGEAEMYCDGDGGKRLVEARGGPVWEVRFGGPMGERGGDCLAGGGRGVESGSGAGALGGAVASLIVQLLLTAFVHWLFAACFLALTCCFACELE